MTAVARGRERQHRGKQPTGVDPGRTSGHRLLLRCRRAERDTPEVVSPVVDREREIDVVQRT